MFGSGQYFRIKLRGQFATILRFYCNLGNDAVVRDVPACKSGECVQTPEGLYWPVKRCSDSEIVLQGCGDDEYIYRSDTVKANISGCIFV